MNATNLVELVVTALMGKTNAGNNVFSPQTWSTFANTYPAILVQTIYDEKHSLGRNAPQFTTTTTVLIAVQTLSPTDTAPTTSAVVTNGVAATSGAATATSAAVTNGIAATTGATSAASASATNGTAANDGAITVQPALETIREQAEQAVINSYDLTRQIQQFKSIRSRMDLGVCSAGQVVQLFMEMDIEYYQGPEDFYPVASVPLAGIDTTIVMPANTTEPVVTINLPQ